MLDLGKFRQANVQRCGEVFFPLGDWSLSDYSTAVAGEVGEACNIVKKIRRGDFCLGDARPALAKELADAFIYLDLLAARAGVDLEQAVVTKFNEVSRERGSSVFL